MLLGWGEQEHPEVGRMTWGKNIRTNRRPRFRGQVFAADQVCCDFQDLPATPGLDHEPIGLIAS
jgi:hypothetical protein